jgi:hypothetical protein
MAKTGNPTDGKSYDWDEKTISWIVLDRNRGIIKNGNRI